jgi:hypothetical protein
MRRKQLTLALLAILFTGLAVHAQDKPAAEKSAGEKPAADKRPPVPVTVTVVFNEFEGEKKISSLPYTLPVNARPEVRGAWNQLRMGVRVPIKLSNDPNVAQTVQYMDVGTNIDCRAASFEGSQFEVELQVERSSIYSVGAEGKRVEWSPDERVGIAAQPIVRRYSSTMTLLMRDGQTIQRSVATDPLSGRLLKVDVTLNVVK